jgi:YD repeat-containing protein
VIAASAVYGSGGVESEIFSYSSANQFDSKQVWVHSPPNQQPFYANFRVLVDDVKRTVTYAYRDNNENTSMADYNGTSAYAYDDWGRMTSETRNSKSRTFSYTMGSKLASVSGNLGGLHSVTYGYSGDGKRLFRTHNGTTTHGYHWDAGYNVLNEADASGALAKTYVVAPKPVTGAVLGVPMEGVLVNQGPVGMTLAEVAGENPATGAYQYYTQDNILSTRGLFRLVTEFPFGNGRAAKARLASGRSRWPGVGRHGAVTQRRAPGPRGGRSG